MRTEVNRSRIHRRRLHRGNRELCPGTHARTGANVAFCPGTFHGCALIFKGVSSIRFESVIDRYSVLSERCSSTC